ncbi:MAG: ABC transporter ATP-binding protein [Deltaproteobacteria bacterium]|nr:ABC transporter ATP-binding protein [Deltaproteobacteria bacterium]
MDQHPIIIELSKISFSYPNGRLVLKDADFTLKTGQKIGLVGHNGSGKSTFLHILVGLLKPNSGAIHFLGDPVQTETDFRRVRKKIGLVFQHADDQLFCPTVLEDISFGLLNQGMDPDNARDISLKLLEDLDLKGFEDRITYRLSGGEKRLVALTTVLVMQPEVLLLDEPFTGLDESTRERIIDILTRLNISYIIVSHEYDTLARTTSDIFSIGKGRIVYIGNSDILHSHFHRHPGGKVHHKHTEHNE